MPRHRLLFEWWIGLALLLALSLFATRQGLDGAQIGQGRLESVFYDGLSRFATLPASDEVIIVDIDDDSLEQIGPWPWPRAIHAEMLRRLVADRAQAIGLDLLLIDATRDDEVLGAELIRSAEAGKPVTMPIATTRADTGITPLYPVSQIGLNARLGHPHFRLDGDGSVRGLTLEEGGFAALSLLLASQAQDADLPALARQALSGATRERREHAIRSGDWPQRGFALLPPLSEPTPHVSFGAVLRNEIAAERFSGRIVLIGASATGLGDRYATALIPGKSLHPGVDLHGVAIRAILDRRLVEPVPAWLQFVLTGVPVLALLIALYRLAARAGLFATLLAAVVVLLIAGGLLRAGYWWSPTSALLAIALAYPIWSWRRLEVATAGLLRQAKALDRDAPTLSATAVAALPTEPVAQSLERLATAAARAVRLRQFLLQSLERLPCPALILDERGHLLFANRKLASDLRYQPAIGVPMAGWLHEQIGLDIAPLLDESEPRQRELADDEGRDWLIDTSAFDDPEWGRVHLLQFVNITPIRSSQREREQTLRFLSHDLRSPQVTILAIIDLQARLDNVPPWLDDIRKEAHRSLELANGFVELARAEGAVIPFDVVDLSMLIEESRDACWRAAQAQQARLKALGTEQSAWSFGDSQLIRRALINLIDNAIKYGPRGGTVTIELVRDANQWCIAVSDEGSGLSDGDIEHLFQPYWRGNKLDRPGIGLGLSFVRVVAERHHGRVSVRAADGGGARFEFRLPVDDEAASDSDQDPAAR